MLLRSREGVEHKGEGVMISGSKMASACLGSAHMPQCGPNL